MMSHHVYLLVHTVDPRFKIGHSFSIKARMAQLGLKEVDTGRSRAYEVSSRGLAQSLERLLHEVARPYRIPSEDISGSGPLRGGETEWFQISCLGEVTSFLQQTSNYIAWNEVDLGQLLRIEPAQKLWRSRETRSQRLQAWGLNMAVLVQKRMAVIEEPLTALHAQVNRTVLLPRYKGALADYRPMVCTARMEAFEYLEEITQELGPYGEIQTEFFSTKLFSNASFVKNEADRFVILCINVNSAKEIRNPIEAYNMPFDALENLMPGIEGWDWQVSADGYRWAFGLLSSLHRNNGGPKLEVEAFH
jgi:hypothetical protein